MSQYSAHFIFTNQFPLNMARLMGELRSIRLLWMEGRSKHKAEYCNSKNAFKRKRVDYGGGLQFGKLRWSSWKLFQNRASLHWDVLRRIGIQGFKALWLWTKNKKSEVLGVRNTAEDTEHEMPCTMNMFIQTFSNAVTWKHLTSSEYSVWHYLSLPRYLTRLWPEA